MSGQTLRCLLGFHSSYFLYYGKKRQEPRDAFDPEAELRPEIQQREVLSRAPPGSRGMQFMLSFPELVTGKFPTGSFKNLTSVRLEIKN